MRSVCGTPTAVSPTPTLGSLKHPSEMDPMPSLWKDGHFGYWCPFHGLQMSTSCQVEAGCLIFISCLICLLLHPPLRLSMGVQEEEVNVVLEDSLDEKYLTIPVAMTPTGLPAERPLCMMCRTPTLTEPVSTPKTKRITPNNQKTE